jgi:hypothetical protein
MARVFPSKQVSLDQGNGTTIVVSKVTAVTSANDFIELPTYTDAVNLNPSVETADPTFYLAGGDRCVGWHGATVGTEYVVCSKHTGIVNTAPGGATAEDPK